MALELALSQIHGSIGEVDATGGQVLGFVYLSDRYGAELPAVVAALRQRTGVDHWTGAVTSSVCATGVEYDGEPALALMLGTFPAESIRLFSGRLRPPPASQPGAEGGFRSHTALVHADPSLPDLTDLVRELSQRTASGYLFGALTSGDSPSYTQVADEAVAGGLSGVMFSSSVRVLSRVTQGCSPLAGEHVISACSDHFLQRLDGRPALDVLLEDLGVRLPAGSADDGQAILRALPAERLRQGLFVGLTDASAPPGRRIGDYLVRNVVGIDPHHRLLAVSDVPVQGDRVVFCTRDRDAARRDLVRIVSELRDEVEEEALTIRGALYHSCVARGSALFGAAGEELETIRHHLGDVPLIGMYGSGEIAGDRIYGYTGVLSLFVA